MGATLPPSLFHEQTNAGQPPGRLYCSSRGRIWLEARGWLEVVNLFLYTTINIKTYLAFLLFNLPIFRWPNQAKVVATKKYKPGDDLEGLEGYTAPLSKREEEMLEQLGRLFSVGHGELLLGVVRFVNHACEPHNNVRFVQKKNRQLVQVRKPNSKAVQKQLIFRFKLQLQRNIYLILLSSFIAIPLYLHCHFDNLDCPWDQARGWDTGELWDRLLPLGWMPLCSQKAQAKQYSCTCRGSVRHSITFWHRLQCKCTILLQVLAKDQSRWRWISFSTFWWPWWRGDRAGQVKEGW